MGTAAVRALALRGRHTLLLERFTFGHAKGSSGGPTRIFRHAYHAERYVHLSVQARPAWDELQRAAGEELLRVTGGIDVGPAALPRARLLRTAGIPVERMTGAQAGERWPAMTLPADADVVFQRDGGVVRAARTVQVQARLAAEAGADLRQEVTVERVTPSERGVEVVTDIGEIIRAPVGVVTAGPWAAGLLGTAGMSLALRPTLEQATYFSLDPSRSLPTVIDWFSDAEHPPYLVPDPFDPGGFKVGLHMSGLTTDAESRGFDADPVRVETARAWVEEHIEGAKALQRTETCLYTVTPDEDFVLDRIGPLVVASPCSGHGFKFAPFFGGAIADLATGVAPPFSIEAFRANRPALRA